MHIGKQKNINKMEIDIRILGTDGENNFNIEMPEDKLKDIKDKLKDLLTGRIQSDQFISTIVAKADELEDQEDITISNIEIFVDNESVLIIN